MIVASVLFRGWCERNCDGYICYGLLLGFLCSANKKDDNMPWPVGNNTTLCKKEDGHPRSAVKWVDFR